MVFRKIDSDGLFVEDIIADTQPTTETGEPDPAYIETPVPPDAGFQWPRWNGETFSWEEGGTVPEQPAQPIDPPATVTPEAFAELETAVEAILDTLEALL